MDRMPHRDLSVKRGSSVRHHRLPYAGGAVGDDHRRTTSLGANAASLDRYALSIGLPEGQPNVRRLRCAVDADEGCHRAVDVGTLPLPMPLTRSRRAAGPTCNVYDTSLSHVARGSNGCGKINQKSSQHFYILAP